MEGAGRMPEELASHSAVQLGHNMLVFGGTAMPFGDSSSDSVKLNAVSDVVCLPFHERYLRYEHKITLYNIL